MAGRTRAFWSQLVFLNQISVALNEHCATVVAMRVFETPNPPRKVARIDVSQSRFTTDGGGAQQVAGTSVGGRGHLVILVKGGDVPRDVG